MPLIHSPMRLNQHRVLELDRGFYCRHPYDDLHSVEPGEACAACSHAPSAAGAVGGTIFKIARAWRVRKLTRGPRTGVLTLNGK